MAVFSPNALLIYALAALWVPIIVLVGGQWSIYEQYHYGWAVPFLCVFFAFRRLASAPFPTFSCSAFQPFASTSALLASMVVLLLLLLPLRVLQEASPLWRLASYLLVINAILISFCALLLASGPLGRRFAFPLLFSLVAIPWPTPIEIFVVQNLTRLNTAAVVEILHAFSVPAWARGNVIELPSGVVGIEEACSGIRSLQAVLMLSLAFGEWLWLGVRSRLLLLGAAVAIAMALNLGRTATLSALTAHGGSALTQRWHDITGIVLLFGCFSLVWIVALMLGRNAAMLPTSATAFASRVKSMRPQAQCRRLVNIVVSLMFFGSLFNVLGTELWFRYHETRNHRAENWTIILPRDKPHFRELPQPKAVEEQLRYDSAAAGAWHGDDGTTWQFFHFRWDTAHSLKDRLRVQLAKSHRPETCLTASGWQLVQEFAPTTAAVDGLALVFRAYEFRRHDQPTFVFFCVREDGMHPSRLGNARESHAARLRAALDGNRGLGQRVIEIALTGPVTRAEAEQLLRSELPHLITIH